MLRAKQLAGNKHCLSRVSLLLGASMLAGCTATTIDTQSLASVGASNPTASNLSLTDEASVPTPSVRPGNTPPSETQRSAVGDNAALSAPIETTARVDSQTGQTAPQPVVSAQAAPGTQPLANTADDTATQRIIQASNAPAGNVPNTSGLNGQNGAANVALAQAPAPAPIAAPTPSTPVAAASAFSAAPAAAAAAPAPKRTGIFRAMFNRERFSPPAPIKQENVELASATPAPAAKPKPTNVISTVSARSASLPGVSRDRALGVTKPKSDNRERIEVASAAGLARLTPNGLKTQHSGVDVKCLKPALVRILKKVESHYGKPVIVTSGYRSPARNKAARGAKNSLHMYCAAADIQVSGVSKWKLASYLRSTAGRGGVGTYCHTKSVHIDIGPKRDWNARCRRR